MTTVFRELIDIDGKGVRFIDTRFDLGNADGGRSAYLEEHIEGAIHWDLERDLSDMSSKEGRHPMITKEKMTLLVQNAGLQLDEEIILYDQGASPFALRAYFLLDWAGFTNVHVSRAGYNELSKAFSVSQVEPKVPPTRTVPAWKDNLYVNVEEVKQIVSGVKEGKLVDARSAVRYRGENEPIDKIAGHIPTALNFDWEQLKENGEFLKQDKIKEKLQHVSGKAKPVIAYCGSGVTAAPLYACLKEAGYENVQLYVGSYSDWIRENEVEKSS